MHKQASTFTVLALFLLGISAPTVQAVVEHQWGPAISFSYEGLMHRAKVLASTPQASSSASIAPLVGQIDYTLWQSLKFRPEAALFGDKLGHYPVTFFHVGSSLPNGIKMFRLEGPQAMELLYSTSYFSTPQNSITSQLTPATGFAGLRVQGPRSPDPSSHEWLTFLGDSYFRAIGKGQVYGVSARALMTETRESGVEDVPSFKEFYLQDVSQPEDPLTIYALLDGKEVTGAFRFISSRSEGVIQDVDADLYIRQPLKALGIAPIRTMYWFSETDKSRLVDWRPEVHDSDGLAILTGAGERIWRPLINPPNMSASLFRDQRPKGFGLIQRDRQNDHYLDEQKNFELRPNVWVELLEGFDSGSLELHENPTGNEINDNVAVFWKPKSTFKQGDHLHLRYRLHWIKEEPFSGDLARNVATRIGRLSDSGNPKAQNYQISVEFEGQLPEGVLEPHFQIAKGSVIHNVVEAVPGVQRWRVVFEVKPHGLDPVDLSLQVRSHSHAVAETWSYRIFSDRAN